MRNRNMIRIKQGIKCIWKEKILLVFPIMYVILLWLIYITIIPIMPELNLFGITNIWEKIISILVVEFAVIGEFVIFIILGTPISSKRIENSFIQARLADKNGCPPMLLAKSKDKKSMLTVYEFYSPIISREEFVSNIDRLRTILKGQIEEGDVEEGEDTQHIIVTVISSKKKFPI